MALIKCKECGKEISDSVKSCPHCGYVYKEEKKMTTGKVIKIVIIMAIVGIALFFGVTYLFFDWIPEIKTKKVLSKYFGTWELVESEYANVLKMSTDEYILKKSFIIDRNNIETTGCGFGAPENGFSVTTYNDGDCNRDYYLVTTMGVLVEGEEKYWHRDNVCFELKNDELIQTTCGLNDNTVTKNANIKYKLKK